MKVKEANVALMEACESRYFDARVRSIEIRKALEAGADPGYQDPETGTTPLMEAAVACDSLACGLLLEAGADVNTRDHDGNSAIFYPYLFSAGKIPRDLSEERAAGPSLEDFAETMAVLIEAGADLEGTNIY